MERKNGYVYGAAAPKLPEKDERPIERKIIPKKVAIRPLPARSPIPKARMMFCVAVVVALSFIVLYRYSAIAELNYQMGTLSGEYSQLRDENRMLEFDIEASINLDRVQEIAETELNMHKPESYQVVLVSVPKTNYSVVVEQAYIDETTQNASLIENMVNAVRAILP